MREVIKGVSGWEVDKVLRGGQTGIKGRFGTLGGARLGNFMSVFVQEEEKHVHGGGRGRRRQSEMQVESQGWELHILNDTTTG